MSVRNFLNKKQKKDILTAIKNAEKLTSGEIRLHLEAKCSEDPLERSKIVFQQLKMNETLLHNGVLIYVAVSDRKLAVFGDKGINDVVAVDFWDNVKDEMVKHFNDDTFSDGIIKVIGLVGKKLQDYFPRHDDDIDELADDISINDAD